MGRAPAPSMPSVQACPCSLVGPGRSEHWEVFGIWKGGLVCCPGGEDQALGERCSVHVLLNLTREGQIPARGERVPGIPGRLGAAGMDACPLLPPAPKSQGTCMQGRGFWHQGL